MSVPNGPAPLAMLMVLCAQFTRAQNIRYERNATGTADPGALGAPIISGTAHSPNLDARLWSGHYPPPTRKALCNCARSTSPSAMPS